MPNSRVLLAFLLCSLLPGAVLRADDNLEHQPIPQQTLLDYLGGKGEFTLIDARTPAEYESGHIWGAANVPHDSDLAAATALPDDKDAALVVYCKTGKRAAALQEHLLAAGYNNVRVLGPAQMLWAGELPVFNCGAVVEPSAALVTTTTKPAMTGGATQ